MIYEAHDIAAMLLAWLENDSGPIIYTDDQVTAIKDSVDDALRAGWAPEDDDITGDICTLAIGDQDEASIILHRFPQLQLAHHVLADIFEAGGPMPPPYEK